MPDPDQERASLPPPTMPPDIMHPWIGGTIRVFNGGGGTASYHQSEYSELSLSGVANTRMISMTCEQRLAFLHEIARGYHITIGGCGHSVYGIGPSGDCTCRPEVVA